MKNQVYCRSIYTDLRGIAGGVWLESYIQIFAPIILSSVGRIIEEINRCQLRQMEQESFQLRSQTARNWVIYSYEQNMSHQFNAKCGYSCTLILCCLGDSWPTNMPVHRTHLIQLPPIPQLNTFRSWSDNVQPSVYLITAQHIDVYDCI